MNGPRACRRDRNSKGQLIVTRGSLPVLKLAHNRLQLQQCPCFPCRVVTGLLRVAISTSGHQHNKPNAHGDPHSRGCCVSCSVPWWNTSRPASPCKQKVTTGAHESYANINKVGSCFIDHAIITSTSRHSHLTDTHGITLVTARATYPRTVSPAM